MVTNPYCAPCTRTHKLLNELLKENSCIQARIVFTANNTDKDIKTPISRHLMALNDLADKTIVERALHDWYEQKQKNYKSWVANYPSNDDSVKNELLDKQRSWCLLTDIKFTPTIFINGRKLPEFYQPEDLEYLI